MRLAHGTRRAIRAIATAATIGAALGLVVELLRGGRDA